MCPSWGHAVLPLLVGEGSLPPPCVSEKPYEEQDKLSFLDFRLMTQSKDGQTENMKNKGG